MVVQAPVPSRFVLFLSCVDLHIRRPRPIELCESIPDVRSKSPWFSRSDAFVEDGAVSGDANRTALFYGTRGANRMFYSAR